MFVGRVLLYCSRFSSSWFIHCCFRSCFNRHFINNIIAMFDLYVMKKLKLQKVAIYLNIFKSVIYVLWELVILYTVRFIKPYQIKFTNALGLGKVLWNGRYFKPKNLLLLFTYWVISIVIVIYILFDCLIIVANNNLLF